MAALCKAQEELQLSGVVHSMPFCTETLDEDTSSVETSDTSSVKALEEVAPRGIVHSMAYCKETCDLLLCNWDKSRIEQISYSSLSGLSLQPQKLWNLREMHSISYPTSVHIARRTGIIFIGCDDDEGIYVLDLKSFRLIKKFAQNMDRDFDRMVVDETEYPQPCTVYASSTNNGTLTKFDYSSGSVINELPVTAPRSILLKDDKLYLICEIDSTDCILVIDKHSLDKPSKIALPGWLLLGGLCLDERSDVCVTAWNDSNHRLLYSFDDGGKVVGKVQLPAFDEPAYVLDMVAIDNDLIILTQECDEFFLKRIQFKF